MTTDARIVVYSPNGASQGVLPAPDHWDAALVLNGPGALNLSYAVDGPRSSLLGSPVELALETSADSGATWGERRNCRFMYLRDNRDPVTDSGWSISCPSYVNRLAKALIPFTGLNANGQRVFTTKTYGDILNTLLTEAQARGALTGIAWDFTAANDSSGTAWGATKTLSYDAGKDYLSILQEWADLGDIDYAMTGRTLQLFRGNTLGGDKTIGVNPVSLRRGRDFTEGPFDRTWEQLADTAYVQGDSGKTVVRTAAGAVKPWGVQETLVGAPGVTDTGTLQVLGDLALALTDDQRTSYTCGLIFGPNSYQPGLDYEAGSYVLTDLNAGVATSMRVRQITLTEDATVIRGNVVLNDRFTEQDILLQRRVQALLNGATPTTGGSPTPYGNDILPPAQCVGLGATSTSYLGQNGTRFGQIALDWADVTTNNDGTAAGDIDHYEVWRRPSGGAFALLENTLISASNTSGYVPGTVWDFQVRAVDNVGNRGAFSSVVTITASGDAVAPNTPATPTVVSVKLGAALLAWNGKDSGGAAMPADFWYAEVHVSTTSGFTPVKGDTTTKADTLLGAAQFPVTGRAPGVYYAKVLAVDTSGNASVASAQATWTVVTVQGTELAADSIDGKTITGALIRTAASGQRIEIENFAATASHLKFFGDGTEHGQGDIVVSGSSTYALIQIDGMVAAALGTAPAVVLNSYPLQPNGDYGDVTLTADHVFLNGVSGVTFGGPLSVGTPLRRFACGSSVGTTINANGEVQVTHNLQANPVSILVTPRAANDYIYVFSQSTTIFTVRVRNADVNTIPATGTNHGFYWAALF